MATVTDVHDRARVLLNDQGAVKFTDAVLLPYTKIAGDELNTELNLNGIPAINNTGVLATIGAGVTTFPGQPADLYNVIELHERQSGSTLLTDFVPMRRVTWEPDEVQTSELRYWDWNGQIISFLGANTSRQVRLRYQYLIPTFSAVGNTLFVINALTHLAARVAALASGLIDENFDRAKILADYAKEERDKLVSIAISDLQALPVRRMKFRAFSRR